MTVAILLRFSAHPALRRLVYGSRAPILSAFQVPPTTPLPAKSPIRFLQNAPSCSSDEHVILVTDTITQPVDRLGNLIRRVPRDVFPKRGAKHLASRLPHTFGEPFDLLEHLIGNGHSRLHTRRITRTRVRTWHRWFLRR